jgi:hypothetical protein
MEPQMSVDIKYKTVEDINGGFGRIRAAIRHFLLQTGKDWETVESFMQEIECELTLDIDEIIGVLGLGDEYKSYLDKIARYTE